MIAADKATRGAPRGNRNAAKYGEPTGRITLRLPVSALTKLEQTARARGSSASAVVAELVARAE